MSPRTHLYSVELESLQELISPLLDLGFLACPETAERSLPDPFSNLAGGAELHVVDHGEP